MKHIDKSKILSTKYKEWVEKLDLEKKKHPHSSRYELDVKMNLFYCQEGLCAYTEMRLCELDKIAESKWQNGRYKESNVDKFGSLDHFNPGLKEDKFFDWDNLFMVHTDINFKKHDKEVDIILKPDLPDYDPYRLLKYNPKTHFFYPHPALRDDERASIDRMIGVLQLNHGMVRYERESYLNEAGIFHQKGLEFKPDRFFTAYQMTDFQDYNISYGGKSYG